jgi:hypothetical protein
VGLFGHDDRVRDLVLAAPAAVAGFGLVHAWQYYATIDGSPRVRRATCLVIAIAASFGAVMLDSRATGSSAMDAALRVALVSAACWGASMASLELLGAAAAFTVVIVFAAPSSSFALVAAVGVGVVGAFVGRRDLQMPHSPFGALAGAAFALFALDLRGIEPVGIPSVMAAFIFVPLIGAWWAVLNRPLRRGFAAALALAVVVGIGLSAAAAIAALSARSDLDAAVRDARAGLDAAQDPARRDEALVRRQAASAGFHKVDGDLGRRWLVGATYVPIVGRYLESGRMLVHTGADLVDQATSTVEAVDLDRLRPVDGRIDLAEVRKVAAQLDAARGSLSNASREVAQARNPWLLSGLEDRRVELGAEVDDALDSINSAADGARAALHLLGGDGPQRILVLQVSNSESRAIGGWPGSFGVLEAHDGMLELVETGKTGDVLTAPTPLHLDAPDDFVARYGSEDLTKDVRPLFLTPDFPTSSRLLVQAYQQITGRSIDAVVSIDAYGFASLLNVTGPVTVAGWPVPLTADNAAEVLLFGQYDQLGNDRGAFQEAATRAVFERVSNGLDINASALVKTLAPSIEQRRIKFFSTDPTSQAFFERVDAAGAIGPVRGDFFQLVTQNQVGNKIDWFLDRKVAYDVRYNPTSGLIESRATITLHNRAPATGLSPLITGSLEGHPTEPGLNRLWLNVYTSLGLTDATMDGQPMVLYAQQELGRRVYWADVSIPAGATRTIVVDLDGQLQVGSSYLLDVARQPTVGADGLSVHVALADGWQVASTSASLAAGSTTATADIAQERPMSFVVDAKKSG